MLEMSGKVAIVTGASRGIGLGIALGLAKRGASVVLAARDAGKLAAAEAQISELGAAALAVSTDLVHEDQVANLFSKAMARFGRLDTLVNNAGAFEGGPLDELSTDDWDRVVAVNLRAPFLCTRAAMQIMKRQKCGRIINIGSISAQRVRPGSAAYSASKHGVWGLTQVTALEGREHGITCTCLHPGNVAVERRQTERAEDAEPMMAVDDLVEVAVLMATLPPNVAMLEAIVLPRDQLYVGRG